MKKPKVIGIIGGTGKMGRYFAEFFKKAGYEVIVSGSRTQLTNKELAKKADAVIVSVTIEKTEEIINEILPFLKKDSVLFDLTSLKVFPMEAMRKTNGAYFGCHPLFGPTNPLHGQLVALCPGRGKKQMEWFKELLEANKVIVKILSAKEHDRMMAYVQALVHFSDIALADALRKSGIPIKKMIDYQSPVYRLELDMMGRILDQSPDLYGPIEMMNPLSRDVIGDYLESCKSLLNIVVNGGTKEFASYFNKCRRYMGSYTKQAMAESDRLIKEMLGRESVFEIAPDDLYMKYDIAVLGPKNTYSDLAVKELQIDRIWYCPSISEVFELVSSGKIKYGFVPVDNSLTGSVRESLDELFTTDVWIEKVVPQTIELALAGSKKTALKNIRTVYSHPQPFLQCRQFIKVHLPNAFLVPVSSTAAALARAGSEGRFDVAAIGMAKAAREAGLDVIRDSVQDEGVNVTHFALIRKRPKRPVIKGRNKTSIAFTFKKDSPGSLYSVLREFADAGINLTKIESRPDRRVQGEYVFFTDFEGSLFNPVAAQTLEHIREKSDVLKVLGCY